jgi:hypothetical protein
MNWVEERIRILDVFEKYPSKKGSRSDLFNENNKYDRNKLISEELGGLWSNGKNIPKVYEMLVNDTESCFFTKGLVKHNWSVPSAYKIFKEDYYEYDKNNDNVIVGKVDNDEIIPTTTTIINVIEKHYKINRENFLYVMEIKDGDYIFPYRKVGVSNSLSGRINTFNTNLPFEIHPIALWNVEFGKNTTLEAYLHKQLNDVHKKGEWFIDSNFDLLNRVRDEIKNIKDIRIKEVFIDDRLNNTDRYSSVMKSVHTHFGSDSDITVDDDLIEIKDGDSSFGIFGMF